MATTMTKAQQNTIDMTATIPTTRTANLLIRDATGAVLREALPLEVEAARASGHAWLPYTLLCPAGEIPCYIEAREVALTDAEYNAQLDAIEITESRRPSRRARARRSR